MSIETGNTDSTEAAAMVLASTKSRESALVLADSKVACTYSKGRISVAAPNIIAKTENPPEIYTVQTPARVSDSERCGGSRGRRTRSPGIRAG